MILKNNINNNKEKNNSKNTNNKIFGKNMQTKQEIGSNKQFIKNKMSYRNENFKFNQTKENDQVNLLQQTHNKLTHASHIRNEHNVHKQQYNQNQKYRDNEIYNVNNNRLKTQNTFGKNQNIRNLRIQNLSLNDNIKHSTLFVLDQDGKRLGIMSLQEALQKAKENNLDLFIIDENQTPPVAKILNYEKYRFQQQKREREEKNQQRRNNLEQKELYFRPITGEHDIQVKVKHAIEFLKKGHRVYIGIKLKGRENKNREIAIQMANRIKDMLSSYSQIDRDVTTKDSEIFFILKQKKT